MRKYTAKTLILSVIFLFTILGFTACGLESHSPSIVPTSSTPALAQERPQKPTEPEILVPPPNSPPSESISPEQKAVKYLMVDEKDLIGSGMPTPRQLSSQEKNSIIQIGLNIEPVSQAIKEGSTYRTDPEWWMLYNKKGSTWSYLTLKEGQSISSNPDIAYFPAVRIGLGTPQSFQVNVAVDLAGQRAVYAIRTYDKYVAAPSYLKPLSDLEKQELIEIASGTKTYQQLGAVQKTEFHWVAISESGGTLYKIVSDIFDQGIPEEISMQGKTMTIYPAVTFYSGSLIADITIDLPNKKIMDTFSYPVKK